MQSTIGNVPSVSRRLRNPVHDFNLRHPPFAIAPFLLAPVLPGETMKNLSFQARCVTRPIKNPLVGWWLEFYIFYVKHRDMTDSALWQSMVLDPGVNVTGASCYVTGATAGGPYERNSFHSGSGIDWSEACMIPVRDNYFRDEGDSAPHLVGIYNTAKINTTNWTDSLTLEATRATYDVNVDLNADTTIKASEVDRAMRQYEMMVAGGLVNMSYEDYLRSYGVHQAQAVKNVPELIRYVREWTYPSSHVDPVTGSASSAVSWSVAERADKDRFFAEPGFIFGVTVCRPKVYMANLKQPGASLMRDAYTWLPAILRDDVASSLAMTTDLATDPLGGVMSGNWWVDVKDLLIYGDQFINYTPAVAPGPGVDSAQVSLPGADGSHLYPVSADIDALFVTAADSTYGVRMDGTVRLSILGTQTDTTTRGSAMGQTY